MIGVVLQLCTYCNYSLLLALTNTVCMLLYRKTRNMKKHTISTILLACLLAHFNGQLLDELVNFMLLHNIYECF